MKKRTPSSHKISATEAKKQAVLQAILPQIPFDGWGDTAYRQALVEAGLSAGEGDLLFPQGVRDLIELFGCNADAAMLDRIKQEPGFSRLRVRDKITFAVRARLEYLQPHREAVRKMMFWYAMPFHMPLGIKCLYRTVDVMWRAAGDTATDFNFYSKRILLAGVIKAIILFWLDDASPNCVESWDFLDRRIGDVMKLGKTISLMKEWKPAEVVELVRGKLKKAH